MTTTDSNTANKVVADDHPAGPGSPVPPSPSSTTTDELEGLREQTRTPPTVGIAERESPADPRVATLRAMFPDYDDAILQSVLESVNWNQDRAVDTLLIMSDPEYKPDPQQQQRAPSQPLSQEALDEQFARQLLIQEENQLSQLPTGRQGRGTQPWGYPARAGHPAQPPQQQTETGEFQDQFSKFAESGKRTIGNIVSKVKAKIQEIDQGRTSDPPNSPTPPTQYPTQQWTPGPASSYGPPPPQPNQPPQASYYNPNYSPPSPSPPAPLSASNFPPPENRGTTTAVPASTSAATHTSTTLLPNSSGAQPIDGGKLGLLPKKPVSLVRDDNTAVTDKGKGPGALTLAPETKGYTVDDDDDDLEYVENPFDDPAHTK